MLRPKSLTKLQSRGFTLVELLVSITIITLVIGTFTMFFNQSLTGYLHLQYNASALSNMYVNSARMTRVLRGVTGVEQAKDNELTVYAYFNPADTYVSKLRYYLSGSGPNKQLKADLTPMTADPPTGTPITAQMRTVTIMNNFYQPASSKLFTYLGAGDQALSTPITDTQPIRSIEVNLAMTTRAKNTYTTSMRVTLRNKSL